MIDLQELRKLAEQASKNSFVSYGNKREQEYAERCRERLNSAAHPCAVLELLDEIERLQESAADKTKDIAYYHEQLAAANARVAELEKQKPSYKAEFDCVYEKLKAEESLSTHYKQRAEQSEAECALLKQENRKLATAAIEQPPYKQDLIDRMKRMEDALREIKNQAEQGHYMDMADGKRLQICYEFAKAALEEKP